VNFEVVLNTLAILLMVWRTGFTPSSLAIKLVCGTDDSALFGLTVHAFALPATPTLQALRVVVTRSFASRTRSTASASLPANTTASGSMLALYDH
jgi:hypothetical protein